VIGHPPEYMAERQRILCYGSDDFPILSRKLVLEHAGFLVTTTTAAQEFQRLVGSGLFDLVILCHSLSSLDWQTALQTVHEQRPPLRCLSLDAGNRDAIDGIVSIMSGPRSLISSVKAVLGNSGDTPADLSII
jgi:DNA-binding response OmpR family regulator